MSIDDAVDNLAVDFPLEQIYFSLQRLEADGLLCEAWLHLDNESAAFWASGGLTPIQAARGLSGASVSIISVGSINVDPHLKAMTSAGIAVRADAPIQLVVTDDYLHPNLVDVNAEALKNGSPWILVNPTGRDIWIGPLFSGKPESGCWECLALRLRSAQFLTRDPLGVTGDFYDPISSAIPTSSALAANLAALEVLKYFASGRNSSFHDRIDVHDLANNTISKHELRRQIECGACGQIQPSKFPEAIVIGSALKAFTADGGHRTCTPSQTLARFEHLISPITGVVDALEPIDGFPEGLTYKSFHVWTAGHNFAFQFKNLRSYAENMRSRSAGKGMTEEQAKAGALAEALERYSAIFRGTEPRVKTTFLELGQSAIHPNHCMQFSDKQYDAQDFACSEDVYHARIPIRFNEEASIDWSPIFSLTSKTWRYLPTQYLFFPSQAIPSLRNTEPYFYADSNGNASGNVIEEAILQGLFELVERDAVALWWYNRSRCPGVDLASFNMPFFDDFIKMYSLLNRETWVLNITSDLKIPTFAAISRINGRQTEDIIFGFGCHLDPLLGISRALTEMNQMLALSFGENETQGIARGLDRDLNHWFRNATTETDRYLVPSNDHPESKATDLIYVSNADIADDLKFCQESIESVGLELLVLDQTRADVGMPAVKVVVPGLRHFWPRFAPGRLYDVPVKLGRHATKLQEHELNPRKMFF